MKLIVNRTDEWFNTEFPEYDHYYICMKLLEKASRNQIRGLTYDKIKLVKLISPSSNQEMIEALDRAVVYLLSRGLIERRKINDFRWDIFITQLGLEIYAKFEEVNHEANKA